MPATHPTSSPDPIIARWQSLALRRHAYYLELLKSGRWRRYFNEQQFAERLRDVMAATRAWDGLAAAPAEPDCAPMQEARPAA